MSNIDKQALREAAERATESDWIVDAHEGWHAVIPVADAVNGNYIIAEFQGPESKRNRDFVATSNPATMLALLDELEDYKAAYEEESRDKKVQRSVIDDALCKLLPGCQYMDPPDGGSVTPLEQVRRMIADYREQLQAAEKRIAELEELGRGVKQFSEFQICHYGATEDYAKGYIDCQNNYNNESPRII
ncbi:ead/Ea22-like family protein [Enterobacter hormaechei]|uniref:ead/Ea22-like family protein n=1 Tax=Enterobacter hormaechei TaxID=158836 RepID=UPI0021C0A62D|nr:ead/Ea22-like family protein [Enterobacter hormaechei]UXI62489.1 ead/Ea22-like family protein [Enterobacter hormaechei]